MMNHALNVKISDNLLKISKKTKVIMAVHILGGSISLWRNYHIVKRKKIILIEDYL